MHTVGAYALLPWRGPMEKPDTACKRIGGGRGGVKGETDPGGSVHDKGTGRVRARGKPRTKARGEARKKRS